MQCTHATSSIGREPVSRCCLHLTWCCSGTIHHSVQICRRHYWRVGRRTEEGEKLKPGRRRRRRPGPARPASSSRPCRRAGAGATRGRRCCRRTPSSDLFCLQLQSAFSTLEWTGISSICNAQILDGSSVELKPFAVKKFSEGWSACRANAFEWQKNWKSYGFHF
ncbi:65-kDa microtubule-associated protein 3 [Zea mays]|uniref:65-kDa microtubule-associated protein 3 n=1 Tax=Zea mays TaxID=4577 RepID=A0A1D6QTV6_MAIZE|nr:65-kDa microtubule-associated protein 3 [Zea mays]